MILKAYKIIRLLLKGGRGVLKGGFGEGITRALDTDGDGTISRKEWKKAPRVIWNNIRKADAEDWVRTAVSTATTVAAVFF